MPKLSLYGIGPVQNQIFFRSETCVEKKIEYGKSSGQKKMNTEKLISKKMT